MKLTKRLRANYFADLVKKYKRITLEVLQEDKEYYKIWATAARHNGVFDIEVISFGNKSNIPDSIIWSYSNKIEDQPQKK